MILKEKFDDIVKINENCFRIGNTSIFVDIVYTSIGIVRIGSMPDISKFMRKYKIEENIIVVPDWYVSQGGDNRTGEGFCFWSSILFHNYPKLFIGKENNVDKLYRNLDMIVSYYFNPSMTKIVKKRWLNKLFTGSELKNDIFYKKDNVKIKFENEKIIIIDNNKIRYENIPIFPKSNILIEKLLLSTPRFEKSFNSIEIMVVGSGNGYIGTASSFVVKLGNYMLWIDPCSQPAFSLGKVGIHWDDVSHILITHNHEDHILGFTACLKRAIDKRRKIKLITAPSIYKTLLKQFNILFPNMEKYIEFISLTPDKSIMLYDSKIEARWNHHIIPYGTLGLKISRKGSCFGFSGDTKYDEKIIASLKRKNLEPKWFENCDIVFHEVDFEPFKTVHTNYKELLKLEKKIKGKLFVYHTDSKKIKGGLNMVLERQNYILNNGKLEIR